MWLLCEELAKDLRGFVRKGILKAMTRSREVVE